MLLPAALAYPPHWRCIFRLVSRDGVSTLTLPSSCHRVPPYAMSHLTKNKIKLLARVRRLKGQIEAIERSLEAEAPCGEVLNLVASVRGAVNGLTSELIEDHIREHVSNPDKDDNPERAQGAAELIEVIRTYLK